MPMRMLIVTGSCQNYQNGAVGERVLGVKVYLLMGDREGHLCPRLKMSLHCKKRLSFFPSPAGDVINQTLPGWE
jgi:hypothetical protein